MHLPDNTSVQKKVMRTFKVRGHQIVQVVGLQTNPDASATTSTCKRAMIDAPHLHSQAKTSSARTSPPLLPVNLPSLPAILSGCGVWSLFAAPPARTLFARPTPFLCRAVSLSMSCANQLASYTMWKLMLLTLEALLTCSTVGSLHVVAWHEADPGRSLATTNGLRSGHAVAQCTA